MAVSQSLTLTEQSYSVADNTSVVRLVWTSTQTGQSYNEFTKTATYTINGKSYNVSYTLPANKTITLVDDTWTIPHNSDGSYTVSASSWMDTGISAGIITKQATLKLTDIPRASTVSATQANIGESTTITINRASSGFTHTLTYGFGTLEGTIATKTSSTSVQFTLPAAFYTQIPNAQSGWGTIHCDTYNGNTLIGSSSCTLIANCNESSCKPTLSGTVVDSNTTTVALTGSNTKFVRYYSNASITATATARNSATLKSQTTACGSKSITTSTGTLNGVESGTFVFSATDSRGYQTILTKAYDLVEYVKLTCSMEASAPTTAGTATLKVSGSYWNGNFGKTANTLTIQYRYKTQGGTYSSWTASAETITKSNNTYSTTISISELDYLNAYTFQVRAIDKLATIESGEQTRKTTPVFDWGKDDFNINGSLTINGVEIFKLLYPVGSIYISVKSTNPKSLFGGSWTQIKDRFLLAAGTTYKAGSTGGEAEVVLNRFQMPPVVWASGSGENVIETSTSGAAGVGYGMYTQADNWGQAHNNMPPYLAVYVWQRTA